MNQGKLKVVKQEMAVLGNSELKWTRMGEFNSDDPYVYNSKKPLNEIE